MHSRTGCEGPEGEKKCIWYVSLSSLPDGAGCQRVKNKEQDRKNYREHVARRGDQLTTRETPPKELL